MHVLLGHLGLAAADLDALVVAQLGPRADADLEGELERRALLGQLARCRGSGLPTVAMPASWTASSYQPGSARRTASSSTASRPTCWSTTCGGTLPLRNPGTFMSRPISPAALATSRSMASGSTSTSTRTRESASSSVWVFTAAIGGGR